MAFELKPFGVKAEQSFVESNHRVNIWTGAVRASKTIVSIFRWLVLIKSLPIGTPMLMCGKTERTLKRNILNPIADIIGEQNIKERIGTGEVNIFGRDIYVVGANDERAQDKIRGASLSIAYLDEVSLYPESFFMMLLSRMSESPGQIFGTTNPEGRNHWLKKNFLDRAEELGIGVWHFTIDDNPHLDPEYVAHLKKSYQGVWYDRYILGKWCDAEGLVYPMMPEKNIKIIPNKTGFKHYICGIDLGDQNPTAFILVGFNSYDPKEPKYVVKEYYYSGRDTQKPKTISQYAQDLVKFLGPYQKRMRGVYVDPSAASFKTELNLTTNIGVLDANNSVLNGIQYVSSLMGNNLLYIDKECVNLTNELQEYSWDSKYAEKTGLDRPIPISDHACIVGDTLVDTVDGQKPIRDLVGTTGMVYSWDGKKMVEREYGGVILTHENAIIFRVELEDGRVIKGTADHPVLTNRGWVQIGYLSLGDSICQTNGKYIPVVGLYFDGTEDVFNMSVTETHCFSVNNGLILHNCDSLRYSLMTHFGQNKRGFVGGLTF